MDHKESLRHLLRVAAGLESQVLGEDEILGQVRRAYRTAERVGALGDVLEPAVLKAIHVGERARSETGINDGNLSLGSAAVTLAARDRGLRDADVLLVGAGSIARTVAGTVVTHDPASLTILNRSLGNAEALAADLPIDARVGDFAALPEELAAVDVVFAATASDDPVIAPADLPNDADPLVIDLGQPRDVHPGVAATVHDLDDLRPVTEAAASDRTAAADAVETIVEEELDLLLDQHKRARADAVIAAMYRGADRVKRREVERALSKLEADGPVTDREREVVESLGDAIVSQLLSVPTRSLREAALEDDWDTVTGAIQLFDPGVDIPEDFFGVTEQEESSADAGD